jgi:signal transduction histidine kinase/ligand-binding sensor domain-containing protein/ActR/RegA family two-component response regulator
LWLMGRIDKLRSTRLRLFAIARGLSIAVLLLLCSLTFAADPTSWMFDARWSSLAEPVFRRIGGEAKVAEVDALAQDANGFLWIGTQRGLIRWDGYQPRVFGADTGNPDALHDPYVNVLYANSDGTLWIGTKASGLARYDPTSDRFASYPVGRGGFPYPTVYAITGDNDGALWVATGSGDGPGSVDRLETSTGIVQTLIPADSGIEARARALLLDREGTLWVGTLSGLLRCEKKMPCRDAGMADGPRVLALYETGDGTIWIGTNRGVYFMSRNALQPQPFRSNVLRSIQDFVEPVPGELWIASESDGLFVVDLKSGRVRHVQHDRALPTTLADDTLTKLFRDRSGLVWIGSGSDLVSYDPQSAVLTVPSEAISPKTSADTWIDVLLPVHDGLIWTGTATDGVYVIDPIAGGSRHLEPKQLNSGVYGLAETSGKIFIVDDSGLARTDTDGRHLERFTMRPRRPDAPINDILADRGSVWLLGFDGFWSLDPNAGIDTPLVRASFSDHLSDQVETTAVWETQSRLWLGTKNGLNRIDTDSDTVTRVLPNAGDDASLRSGFITKLFLDRQHRLWVGTASGLYRLASTETDAPAFEAISLPDVQPADILSILQADDGAIWIGTVDGLVTIDPDTLATRPLQRAEGVTSRLRTVNAACTTSAGELLFGGIDGITVVRPNRLQTWDFHPPIAVTSLRIGGNHVPALRYADAVNGRSPLVIAPNSGGLSVEFAALDYSAPQRNRYAYRLDGVDRDWIDSDPQVHAANYTQLPAGDFTLRLRGSNRDGVWSDRDIAIAIRVLPPWYRTAWALVVYAALFVATLWLTGTWRVRRAARATRILENTVAERTADLASANAQLEDARQSAEEATRAKSAFLANMSHEIRTPMNAVLGFAQLGLRQPLSPKTLTYLDKIANAGKNLLGIINDILDFSKIESGRLVLERVPFDVRRTLDEVRDLFSVKATEQRLEFSITCEPDVPAQLLGDPLRLSQVLINLVGNALKFTRAGFVRVNIATRQCTNDAVTLHVAIQDSGIGMDDAQRAQLFVPFSQADSSTTRIYGGTGLGLTISQRIVAQMGGAIEVRSAPAAGSVFVFDASFGVVAISSDAHRQMTNHPQAQTIAGVRVLLAEDNPINQELAKEIIGAAGASVVLASTGDEAVHLATHEHFDCVLMDIQMPNLDGYAATALIRQDVAHGKVPIIAMTAHASDSHRLECLAAGMDDYVTKPIDARNLIDKVKRWTDK